MPAPTSYDYAVVRVVPRVDREEFINAGVILFSKACHFLAACVEVDEERLRALVDASPLAIIVSDFDDVIHFWSVAAERMFGWMWTSSGAISTPSRVPAPARRMPGRLRGSPRASGSIGWCRRAVR